MKTEILQAVINRPMDPHGPPLLRYIVRVYDPDYPRPLFIRTASANCYRWTTDRAHARLFTLAAARRQAELMEDLATRPDW